MYEEEFWPPEDDPGIPGEFMPVASEDTDSTVSPPSDPVETNPETVPDVSQEASQAVIYEDLSGTDYQELTAVTVDHIEVIQVIETVGTDIAHANLFAGFLVCGTLVGIFLLRGRYGT